MPLLPADQVVPPQTCPDAARAFFGLQEPAHTKITFRVHKRVCYYNFIMKCTSVSSSFYSFLISLTLPFPNLLAEIATWK